MKSATPFLRMTLVPFASLNSSSARRELTLSQYYSFPVLKTITHLSKLYSWHRQKSSKSVWDIGWEEVKEGLMVEVKDIAGKIQ
jgi:hypothetical protein